MASNEATPVVITGIGPMCRAAATGAALVHPNGGTAANGEWFDPVRYLGERKFKYLPNATRYMLAAAGVALADAGLQDGVYHPDQRGAIIGTNFAVFSVHEQMDRTILSSGALSLSPMEAANFSVNLVASHVSLRYGFRAFNVCLTSPMTAGLEALIFAAQAIRSGRCEMALAGASEEPPPQRVEEAVGAPAGDGGACAFVLERLPPALQRGAKIYARIGEAALKFMDPHRAADPAHRTRLGEWLAEDVQRLLPGDAKQVAWFPPQPAVALNQVVDGTVRQVFAQRGVTAVCPSSPARDAGLITVSPMLQLAAAVVQGLDCLIAVTSPHGNFAALASQQVNT